MILPKISDFLVSLNDKNKLAKLVYSATILSIGIFIPYYLFTSIGYMAITDTIMVLGLLAISPLFERSSLTAGKTLYLAITTMYLVILTFLFIDYNTNTNLFFFLLIIVSLTIADYEIKSEKILAVFFAMINLILIVLSELLVLTPVFDLPENTIQTLGVSNTIVFGILLTVIFYFYNYSILKFQHQLNQYATTDPLTGILNRREFVNKSKQLFKESHDRRSQFSFLIFDIDYFKVINDTYGHPAEDRVLVELSNLISEEIHTNDLFARYGGEEFVVLYNSFNKNPTWEFAENIRQKIETTPFFMDEKTTKNVTVSIGVCSQSQANAQSGVHLESMLHLADKALYDAKKQGRNQCVLVEN